HRPPPISTLFPYTTLFRSQFEEITMSQVKVSWKPPAEPNGILLGYYVTYETLIGDFSKQVKQKINDSYLVVNGLRERVTYTFKIDRKSTRLNSSHVSISYA